MIAFLDRQKRRYEAFAEIGQQLLKAGFVPIATAPWQDGGLRTDHTPRLLGVAASFPADNQLDPLKLFSLGPVYVPETSRWTETIDVEWVGSVGDTVEGEVLRLLDRILGVLVSEDMLTDPAVMVMGNVGWVRQLGEISGLDSGLVDRHITHWQSGDLTELPDGNWPPKALRDYFRPTEETAFFSRVGPVLGVSRKDIAVSHARMLWDLSMVGRHPYYTGLVFSVYHPKSGAELLSGGEFALTVQGRRFTGMGFVLRLADQGGSF